MAICWEQLAKTLCHRLALTEVLQAYQCLQFVPAVAKLIEQRILDLAWSNCKVVPLDEDSLAALLKDP